MRPRRIAVMTGTRAEYGLLEPILRLILRDRALRLQLIVTGTHLSAAHGMTVREIERGRIPIAARVDMRLLSDSPEGIASSMSAGLAGFSRAYRRLRPDLLLVLGDRFEVLSAVVAALPLRLPIAHIHGGEATEGSWDESIRHAVTKLSHIHFPAAPAYARRILQMGEDPRHVHCFGSPGLDAIRETPRLTRTELEKSLGLALRRPVGLITFHSETLSPKNGLAHLGAMLSACSGLKATWICTAPNADTGGKAILNRLRHFVQNYRKGHALLFASLGQTRYFSLLAQADVMVGNSSSGLLEAPYFGLPVVNVGARQKGRIQQANVIDIPHPSAAVIARALRQALSPAFRARLSGGLTSQRATRPSRRIIMTLKRTRLGDALLHKNFHED